MMKRMKIFLTLSKTCSAQPLFQRPSDVLHNTQITFNWPRLCWFLLGVDLWTKWFFKFGNCISEWRTVLSNDFIDQDSSTTILIYFRTNSGIVLIWITLYCFQLRSLEKSVVLEICFKILKTKIFLLYMNKISFLYSNVFNLLEPAPFWMKNVNYLKIFANAE